MFDGARTRDQDVGDERGLEQAVLDEARRRRQARSERQRGRRTRPGSRRSRRRRGCAARRARWPARARAASSAARTRAARAAPVARAGRRSCSAEAITTKRSAAAATIFSRVWAPPPPLISPAVRRDLVGAVDRDVERPVEALERADVDAESARLQLRARRRRDAADVEPARGEGGQQVVHGRPGAEPDGHPVRDERGGGLRGDALLAFGVRHSGDTQRRGCGHVSSRPQAPGGRRTAVASRTGAGLRSAPRRAS